MVERACVDCVGEEEKNAAYIQRRSDGVRYGPWENVVYVTDSRDVSVTG